MNAIVCFWEIYICIVSFRRMLLRQHKAQMRRQSQKIQEELVSWLPLQSYDFIFFSLLFLLIRKNYQHIYQPCQQKSVCIWHDKWSRCHHTANVLCYTGARQENVGGFDWERERRTWNFNNTTRKGPSRCPVDETGKEIKLTGIENSSIEIST